MKHDLYINQKVVYVTSYSQYILKHKILLQAGKFNIFGQGEGEVYVLINIASFLCNACNEKKNHFCTFHAVLQTFEYL